MRKIIPPLFYCSVLLLVIDLLFRGFIPKLILVKGIKSVMGVSLEMENVQMSIVRGAISVRGLKILNPPNYPERILADIPELELDVNMKGLFTGKTHLQRIVLNLRELVILRDEEGILNLSALKPVKEGPDGEADEKPEKKKKKKPFKLDYLRLSLGTGYYRDYRAGDSPPTQEYKLDIQNKEYRDINDPGELIRQILGEALSKTVLKNMGNDLDEIRDRLERRLKRVNGGTMTRAQKAMKEAVETIDALQFLEDEEPVPAEELAPTEEPAITPVEETSEEEGPLPVEEPS